jgi:hypothetical protein
VQPIPGTEVPIPQGKGQTDVCSPLEILVPAGYQNWKDVRELIRVRWRTKSYYEASYPELVDQIFEVTINNRFLTVSGRTPDVLSTGDTVTYLIPQSGGVSPSGGSTCQFTIGSRALSASTFNTYGTKNNKSLIRTYINVKGSQSGASTDIEVNITQT